MQVAGQHWDCLQSLVATGARVSNAYPTCPAVGNSPAKVGLMPHGVLGGHLMRTKGFGRCGMGMRRIRQAAGRRPTAPTILRGSERKVPHTGTETRTRLLPVPAAAVIRKVRALSGFIGFKGSAGGLLSVT